MCLAKVYPPGENKKPALENVTHISVEGNHISVETLFGEKQVFQGKIKTISFTDSKVLLAEK